MVQQPARNPEEAIKVPGAPHHDGVELPAFLDQLLGAHMQDRYVRKPELPDDGAEEGRSTPARLDQRQADSWPHDLDGNAGNAGSGTQVQNGPNGFGKNLHEQKAVEKEVVDDPEWVGRAHQPLNPLPLDQQPEVLPEGFDLWLCQGTSENQTGALPQNRERATHFARQHVEKMRSGPRCLRPPPFA